MTITYEDCPNCPSKNSELATFEASNGVQYYFERCAECKTTFNSKVTEREYLEYMEWSNSKYGPLCPLGHDAWGQITVHHTETGEPFNFHQCNKCEAGKEELRKLRTEIFSKMGKEQLKKLRMEIFPGMTV